VASDGDSSTTWPKFARVRAASFLHVIGNPHAEGFYVSCGFRVTGTFDTRFGVGLAMRRPL
jgi:hypothetical protein